MTNLVKDAALTTTLVTAMAMAGCAPATPPAKPEVVPPATIETSAPNEPDSELEPTSEAPSEAPSRPLTLTELDLEGVTTGRAPPANDRDVDGVDDSRDQCPGQAEDRDGYQDDDGCPDPDNDGDGIADSVDNCPGEPENLDGVQDQDGCPEGTGSQASKLAQARSAFRDGLSAYEQGDYAGARKHFEAAYALAPLDPMLFNLARTALRQGDHAAACRYYDKWRGTPKGKTAPANAELDRACP